MAKEREIYSLDIVILGSFNPVIITPYWLATKNLIRETEADIATVEIIHPDVTRYDIDWLSVEITNNRAVFRSRRESHFLVLRDLIVSIFNVLRETPLRAFGINHLSHYSLRDSKEYENFGYWLSPVQQFSDILYKPRLQSILFTESKNDNKKEGLIRLTISPSNIIKDGKSVLFNCNHHFENNDGTDAKQLMTLLVDIWQYSFDKVNKLSNEVWDKAKF